MSKVNLDALIPREDFEVQTEQSQSVGRNINALAITELKHNTFFFSALRKPDFQRETNEWDAQKISGLIESVLDGDLVPAIILWQDAGSYTFVIDGSHRLSALAAWINDDYGDGTISREFYQDIIPEEQIDVAEKTRTSIRKKIGSFKDFEFAITNPHKVREDIKKRAKTLGTLAFQLQWVNGNANKAEESFFKINQEAAPINKTELLLLEARKKPNGVAARAIIRSGKGHKYWSRFDQEKQTQIQQIAKEVNKILFIPPLKNPIKTLDLPIGGKVYSAQTLSLILYFVNIVNGIKLKSKPKKTWIFSDSKVVLEDDFIGDITFNFLLNCKKIARRINSNHPSSLGLHPAVYFYSRDGRYKTASFYAISALMLELETKKMFDDFTQIREKFEELLLKYEYFIQQIVRKHRSAINSYEPLKNFYMMCILKLLEGKTIDEVVNEIVNDEKFNYLIKDSDTDRKTTLKDFTNETKSAIFIKEALSNGLKCKICHGYIHLNSISIDHIVRKRDGGFGTLDNAQLTHPYCNTTFKH